MLATSRGSTAVIWAGFHANTLAMKMQGFSRYAWNFCMITFDFFRTLSLAEPYKQRLHNACTWGGSWKSSHNCVLLAMPPQRSRCPLLPLVSLFGRWRLCSCPSEHLCVLLINQAKSSFIIHFSSGWLGPCGLAPLFSFGLFIRRSTFFFCLLLTWTITSYPVKWKYYASNWDLFFELSQCKYKNWTITLRGTGWLLDIFIKLALGGFAYGFDILLKTTRSLQNARSECYVRISDTLDYFTGWLNVAVDNWQFMFLASVINLCLAVKQFELWLNGLLKQ